MRVLLADDEALTRMGLRAMLREMGHEVVGAAVDGVSALGLACRERPDLAILDIRMPGMDGLAVAEEIAERCPLAVIMLTAYSERDLVERATRTETVQAYLVKPVRDADLAPAIELAAARFAEWQALRQEVADRNEALRTRGLLEQAKRQLMENHGCRGAPAWAPPGGARTEHEAFLLIQRLARRQQRTMRQVAEEILAGGASLRSE
jgi:response regulator NasT